jgi:hypothetical protein
MENTTRVLRWLARGLSAASIGIIALFFLGEGFDPTRIAALEWIGLAFFPVGVVVGCSWRGGRRGWGGSIAVISLAGFYCVYGLLLTGKLPGGCAFVVFTAPALWFLACWIMANRGETATA